MAQIRKVERNKELVKKKNQGWSYAKLSKYFNIDVRAAWEIYQRDGKPQQEEALRLSTEKAK